MTTDTTQQYRYIEALEALCVELLPVISLNIESSKTEIESGIGTLSNQFSALYSKLTQVSQPHFHRLSHDELQQLEIQCGEIRTHLKDADPGLTKVVDQLLGHVKIDHPEAQGNEDSVQTTRSEIEEILLALQFQDRISQILGHALQHLTHMITLIEDGQQKRLTGESPELPDIAELLKQMNDAYTTPEERLNQSRHETHVINSNDNNDLTFF